MIHVRADQVKNTKNAVADNFSGSRYSESHLLRCDLYRTEKVGLYFFPDSGWYAEVSELQEVF